MALVDPNIALGFRQPEQPNLLGQYAQIAQLQSGQQAQQLNALKLQEAQAGLQERNALRQLDPSSKDYAKQLMRVSPTQGLAYQKSVSEAATAEATRGKTQVETAAAKQKLMSQGLRDISTRPSEAQITAYLEDVTDSPLFTDAEKLKAQQNAAMLLSMPFEERKSYLASQGATAAELKPTIQQQNVGGTMRALSFPAYGGAATVVPGSEATATMTPYQKGQLAVSQGQLKVAQDRLVKEGATLDPTENAALSKAILEGRLDPNKVNGRNARILATTLLADPAANLLELGVSAGGAAAATKSLATQTAKMSTAANEANQMIGIVRDLSGKVDRTEFPTINAISNAVSKGTGGKEIVQLNTSINALVNSYARAISPTGQPTVSDKNHAREVINSAYSQGQIGAILDVMQQEMGIAREAASTATTELKAAREKERGRPGAAPAGGGALSPAEQTELDQLRKRFGGK